MTHDRNGRQFSAPGDICGAMNAITSICRDAWSEGLMRGWSGNASICLRPGEILITASGAPKGRLRPEDLLLIDASGHVLGGNAKPSTESAMHLAIYAALPECGAILHTHPPRMQAVGLMFDGAEAETFAGRFLNMNLFESRIWRQKLDIAAPETPGSWELAAGAARCLERACALPRAIWLRNHGLCALARDMSGALALTEELEYLAEIQVSCSGIGRDLSISGKTRTARGSNGKIS